VEGRRQHRRALEPRHAPRAIDHRHRKLPRDADVPERADLVEKRQRVRITSEHHVLTVVDELAGVPVDECGGATAHLAPRLQHQHARPLPGEADGPAQAGEPGAHDHRVVPGHG
jgi:hypothetical protein